FKHGPKPTSTKSSGRCHPMLHPGEGTSPWPVYGIDVTETWLRRLATKLARAFGCIPSKKQRAQGMPDAGRTHGPPATKNAGGSHHRSAETVRHSPRDGLSGCFVLSPGCRAC